MDGSTKFWWMIIQTPIMLLGFYLARKWRERREAKWKERRKKRKP